jgi:3-phenylpropionate/trans-cinnamate dioxygenase ferredoxin reductase component
MSQTFVIVGASHAAAAAIDNLRRFGFGDNIVLVGDEPYLPYQRPPLSKKFLLGELPLDRLGIRQEEFYTKNRVDVRLNARVTSIKRTEQRIFLKDGSELAYDKLILCTGSRVRKLTVPGSQLKGVHYLRTVDDVKGMQPELQAGKRMVVIGAGYIGLETAAAASKLGLTVVVLEMADRCLNRVTAPVVSEFYARRHAQSGVQLFTNTRVEAVLGDSHVTGVRCADGREFAVDVVVAGIGIVPEQELASEAGITCDNGIVVNEQCQTSDPNIYAAGDNTVHQSHRYGYRVRLESVDNAMEQARIATSNLCGKPAIHNHTPWFWSDQYEVKLQTAGLLTGHDQQVVRGDPNGAQFSVWYLRAGDGVSEVLAVDAINRPGDFMAGKRWIGERKSVDVTRLGDITVDLKSL